MREAIAGVGRDVARLGPAIYIAEPARDERPGRVLLVARNWGGALYVIAINPTYHSLDATMHQSLLNGRTLTVLGESRKIRSVNDAFGDSFAPLAVHIYYAGPNE